MEGIAKSFTNRLYCISLVHSKVLIVGGEGDCQLIKTVNLVSK